MSEEQNSKVHGNTRKAADMALAKRAISRDSHAAILDDRLALAEARELGRDRGPSGPAKPESRISKDEQGQPCWCNCGAWTKPGRRYLPGHDQRNKGTIKRAIREGKLDELTDRQREYAVERNLIQETHQQMKREETQREAKKSEKAAKK